MPTYLIIQLLLLSVMIYNYLLFNNNTVFSIKMFTIQFFIGERNITKSNNLLWSIMLCIYLPVPYSLTMCKHRVDNFVTGLWVVKY